ncbi:acyltransferase family protein [Candidatus Lokiarchaeum ossiferum]
MEKYSLQQTEIFAQNPEEKRKFFQIDLMKAIMIALVIMDHSFTHAFLRQYGSYFWERIAIPILMIIMGFNMGKSYKGKKFATLKEYYTRSYFESKLKRYMIPYLLLYVLHGIIRLIVTEAEVIVNSPAGYDLPSFRYIGFTFFYGPGLWFIPVLFGSILVFPILYYNFNKNPKVTFGLTFAIEFLTHIVLLGAILIHNIGRSMDEYEPPMLFFILLYSLFILISSVGIGLWLSVDHDITSKHNRILWVLFPISVVYMILYFLEVLPIPFPMGDYQMFFFPYSAVIFMTLMKIVPPNPKGSFSHFIRKVSRATYHILLTQIFYFSIIFQFFLIITDGNNSTLDVFDANPLNYLWFYPLNLIITFGIGLLWKELEDRFYAKRDEKKSFQRIYQVTIILAGIAFVAWLVSSTIYTIISLISL